MNTAPLPLATSLATSVLHSQLMPVVAFASATYIVGVLFGDFGMLSTLSVVFVLAGGGAGAGGNTGGTHSTAVSPDAARAATGHQTSAGDHWGNSETGDSMGVEGTSTPFLLTWNGAKFEHENDFLFAKPNSAFSDYEQGLKSYQKGITGDIYLLKNNLVPHENGELKLQIRELEPEESFIDTFTLNALDLKPTEHFIADGNLKQSYIFNTEAVTYHDATLTHHSYRFTQPRSLHNQATLTRRSTKDTTLHTGDELVLTIAPEKIKTDKDLFLLVDSHYRDWSLGEQVPFSVWERLHITSQSIADTATMALTGFILVLGTLLSGNNPLTALKEFFSVPHTYADVPAPPPDNDPICFEKPCNTQSRNSNFSPRSLVISAGSMTAQTYLQTLFPRYVQAAQEVVRIPRELIRSLGDTDLVVRIKATKKHKVCGATLFSGEATEPQLVPLTFTKVVHQRTGTDHTHSLTQKNGQFLHTIPGDVVDVLVQDTPRSSDTRRHYVLTTHGFYTKLSQKVAYQIGPRWLSRLHKEDRKLLKTLRLGV